MNLDKRLLLFIVLISFPAAVSAEFYRYTDTDGSVRFTDDYSRVPGPQRTRSKEYITREHPEASTRADATHAESAPPVSAAESAALKAQQQTLERQRRELDREYQTLTKEKETLDRLQKSSSGENLKEWNRKIIAFNKKIDAYDERRNAFDNDAKRFNAAARSKSGKPDKTGGFQPESRPAESNLAENNIDRSAEQPSLK